MGSALMRPKCNWCAVLGLALMFLSVAITFFAGLGVFHLFCCRH